MSMIPEVKCRRCGERFSAMRSRCPNCGTRRVTQSGRTPGATPGTVQGTASYERAETNTKWQMIFGLILVVAVILAVIVMVSSSLNGADNQSTIRTTPTYPSQNEGDVVPTIDTAPTPEPTPTPKIESISIVYNNAASGLFYGLGPDNKEFPGTAPTLNLASPEEDWTFHVAPLVYPATVSVSADAFVWTSEDPEVLQVTPTENGEADITILATKAGGVVVTCEAYGVVAKMRVYCVNR